MAKKGQSMHENLREFSSYMSSIIPIMRVRMIVQPTRVNYGGNKAQCFLHYATPISPEHILVIYIHGDGWNSGSPSDFHFIGQNIALQGYDCIMLGYRKTPKFRFDDIRDDIFAGYKAALDYIAEQNLHYNKIVIMGSSAGAHLGALLCFDSHSQKKFDIKVENINGLISLAGPLCFGMPQTGTLNRWTRDLFFGTRNRAEGDPIMLLKQGQKVPSLIIHSRRDGLIGFEQAQTFCKKAISLDIPAELYEISNTNDTHYAYSVGLFLKERGESEILDKIYTWIDML